MTSTYYFVSESIPWLDSYLACNAYLMMWIKSQVSAEVIKWWIYKKQEY